MNQDNFLEFANNVIGQKGPITLHTCINYHNIFNDQSDEEIKEKDVIIIGIPGKKITFKDVYG